MSPDSIEAIIAEGKSYHGLSSLEAETRLKEYGYNARPQAKKKNQFGRLWRIFSEPMMLLLIATAVVYFLLGDSVEAIVVALSIIPIGIIEFFQEQRTNKAIEILDTLLVEECQVNRDGRLLTLESKFLVPGDMIYLTAGAKVPADGVVIYSPGLMVDESVLTGESAPNAKLAAEGNVVEENKLYQGAMVVQGKGYAVIVATGGATAYGKLGNLLEKIIQEKTPLQRKFEKLVRVVAIAAVLIALATGLLLTLRHGLLRGVLGALTVAISIIPEEFAVVFSVFLIMGVWRMTKKNALVREMAMVEVLGSATVICSDKTGTLTEGKMSLQKVYFDGKIITLDNKQKGRVIFEQLISDALLALEQVAVDPIEVEVQRFSKNIGLDPKEIHTRYRLHKDSPFNASSKMVHHSWEGPDSKCHQYTAGAPERVIASSAIPEAERRRALEVFQELAELGYRVIGVAKRPCSSNEDFAEDGFSFSGLLAMADPPRAGVKEAVATCEQAGIRVVMITGDNQFTAQAVGKAIGLNGHTQAIGGEELEKLSSEELGVAVENQVIFYRVKPEQKYLIVEALQGKGEVVAMTGDGVNDAPALKKANIGIAMGKKGTEVARAAAGMVLLDDNFATIVRAVEEGRRVYDNLRKSFVFLLSFHIPIVVLSLAPLFLGQDLFFVPVSIIFLEFFSDPAAVLGFERERPRQALMRSAPRSAREPLINRHFWGQVILQGGGYAALSFGLYYYFGIVGGDINLGRTLAFVALVVSQIFTVIFSREWRQVKENTLLLAIGLITLVVLNIIIFVPTVRDLFVFVPVSLWLYAVTNALSLASAALLGWFAHRKSS